VGLIDKVQPTVDSLMGALLADSRASKSVCYRLFAGQSFDSAAGHNVDAYVDYRLTAVKVKHNVNSLKWAGSGVEKGDVVYVFRSRELPAGISLKDQLLVDGEVLSIKAIDPIYGLVTGVTVEGNVQ